jgi:hypothetical protein
LITDRNRVLAIEILSFHIEIISIESLEANHLELITVEKQMNQLYRGRECIRVKKHNTYTYCVPFTIESDSRHSGMASNESRLFCRRRIRSRGAEDKVGDSSWMKFSSRFKSSTCMTEKLLSANVVKLFMDKSMRSRLFNPTSSCVGNCAKRFRLSRISLRADKLEMASGNAVRKLYETDKNSRFSSKPISSGSSDILF